MDDLGINKWLLDNYGKTIDGHPCFRLTWSTGVTELRHSEFHDFYGDIFIRRVVETREVLKYPFAQNRWIIERIAPINKEAKEMGLVSANYSYEEVYTFQDKEGNFLPLSRDKVEAALFLYFKYFLQLNQRQRTDMRMEMLAKRELAKKTKTREAIGELRSPYGFVLGKRH